MPTDPYAILGLKRGASRTEIHRAFRKLAKQHHPDVNQGNKAAEDRFKQLTAAYDQLSGKAPPPTEIAPPAGYDFKYVSELEDRIRSQRRKTKTPGTLLGNLINIFRRHRTPPEQF